MHKLTRLRSNLIRAVRKWPKSCGVALPYNAYMYCGDLLHKDPCAVHHGRVLAAWVEALQDKVLPQEAFHTALVSAASSLVKARQPWKAVHDAAGLIWGSDCPFWSAVAWTWAVMASCETCNCAWNWTQGHKFGASLAVPAEDSMC
eukprot:4363180-Amphidinium_carterae.1